MNVFGFKILYVVWLLYFCIFVGSRKQPGKEPFDFRPKLKDRNNGANKSNESYHKADELFEFLAISFLFLVALIGLLGTFLF